MSVKVYRYRPVFVLPPDYPVPPIARQVEGEPSLTFVDVTAGSLGEATQIIVTACNDPAHFFARYRDGCEPVTYCPFRLESVLVPAKALPPGLMVPCREGYESAHDQLVTTQARVHRERGGDDDERPHGFGFPGFGGFFGGG